MTADNTPTLADLEYIPYIDTTGQITEDFQGKVGVYAIFDQQKVLQYVGFSRDVYLSLKQHLIRQPQHCYWFKVQTIERPSRTILEGIQNSWIAENGSTPAGNAADAAKWTDSIDVKAMMTAGEVANYRSQIDELGQMKLLKNVSRRVEQEILNELKSRGVQMEIRFNPKLKEKGLLDLK